MAEPAETIFQTYEKQEHINRRTDDILFNVRYLAENCLDKKQGLFALEVENDVLQQDKTEIAEADIHKLGTVVRQRHDPVLGQYISLGAGTIDNNIKGCEALDMDDEGNHFEFFRRVEEITDEVTVLEPYYQEGMRSGRKKVFISPSPTHHEVDPEVAIAFGYDDRTMFRIQSLSNDGQLKAMQSFSVFDIPAKAWAAFLADRYNTPIEPTALAVMQHCNQIDLEDGTVEELLRTFIGGVMKYVSDDDKTSLQRQLDAFLYQQVALEEQAEYYAQEKLAFEKELAVCWQGPASPQIISRLRAVWEQLKPDTQRQLSERLVGDNLYVDDYVAELLVQLKTVTIDNRAGLATYNERTIKRAASKIGLATTLELAAQEQHIQQFGLSSSGNDFMIRRAEQQIAEAGLGCGGGCSVSVVDLFSEDGRTAKEAGLTGTLYESRDLDKNSRCDCPKTGKKAKVISDGKNVVCVTCGDYLTNGKRGSLGGKKDATHAQKV